MGTNFFGLANVAATPTVFGIRLNIDAGVGALCFSGGAAQHTDSVVANFASLGTTGVVAGSTMLRAGLCVHAVVAAIGLAISTSQDALAFFAFLSVGATVVTSSAVNAGCFEIKACVVAGGFTLFAVGNTLA